MWWRVSRCLRRNTHTSAGCNQLFLPRNTVTTSTTRWILQILNVQGNHWIILYDWCHHQRVQQPAWNTIIPCTACCCRFTSVQRSTNHHQIHYRETDVTGLLVLANATVLCATFEQSKKCESVLSMRIPFPIRGKKRCMHITCCQHLLYVPPDRWWITDDSVQNGFTPTVFLIDISLTWLFATCKNMRIFVTVLRMKN